MSIDWGETIGYTVIDIDSGKIVLKGSSKDHFIHLSIFKLLSSQIVTVVFESINAPETKLFTTWLDEVINICSRCNISIDTVSPSIWKNSFAKAVKPSLTNHAIDSYRIAHYQLTKMVAPTN